MPARHIIRKDLLILTRDRRAAATLVFMPLIFIAILGLSTGRIIRDENTAATLQIAWVDQSGSPLAAAIGRSMRERDEIEWSPTDNDQRARQQVDDGRAAAAVIVGPDFQRSVDALDIADWLDPGSGKLANGLQQLDIHLYAGPVPTVKGIIAEQLIFSAAIKTLLPHAAAKNPIVKAFLATRSKTNTPSTESDSTAQPRRSKLPVRSGDVVYRVIVPGYTVMFAFFLINIMARSFISERQEGTLLRLQASPISRTALLLGKTIPFLIISIVQGLLLFIFGRLLFGMSWGEQPWILPLVIVCTSLAATGLGLLTAVWVRTDAQVSAYANLMVIALAGISGCFMPRSWLPDSMRTLSLATPHAWALIAYEQLLGGRQPDLPRVLGCCAVLTIFGIGFFILGAARFRRQLPG